MVLFKELDKAECVLPDNAKGYLLLRDARLPDKSWDTIETWTKGTYELETIKDSLRELERPVPGRGGKTHIIGLAGYAEATDEVGRKLEWLYFRTCTGLLVLADLQFFGLFLFRTPCGCLPLTSHIRIPLLVSV